MPVGSERYELEDGWELFVEGGVTDDGGWSGGHNGGVAGLAWKPGTPQGEVDAAIAALRADDLARSKKTAMFSVRARHGDMSVLVHEEKRPPCEGAMRLYWPPVVGPHGVLLRRAIESTGDANPDHPDGRLMWSTEMQHPWLVRPDGSVTTLPFELGVSPLCVLPDGRYLLPGADALWRDSYAEPLSALSLDGTIEPLRLGGQPLTPPRIVGAVVPAWMPTPDEGETEDDFLHEFPWWARRARVDAAVGELVVLFVTDDLDDHIDPLRWFVVAIPLNGHGDLRLVARGIKLEGEPLDDPL